MLPFEMIGLEDEVFSVVVQMLGVLVRTAQPAAGAGILNKVAFAHCNSAMIGLDGVLQEYQP